MAVDENGNEIITTSAPETSRSQERITELSEKVRLTAAERDEKDRLLQEQMEKNAQLEKENTFNSGFADVLSQHAAAKDHKDAIKEKVMAGYSVKDATWAVLGEAGALNTPAAPPKMEVAGGSAATVITNDGGGTKTPQEMTQDERRSALMEHEAELSDILAPTMKI